MEKYMATIKGLKLTDHYLKLDSSMTIMANEIFRTYTQILFDENFSYINNDDILLYDDNFAYRDEINNNNNNNNYNNNNNDDYNDDGDDNSYNSCDAIDENEDSDENDEDHKEKENSSKEDLLTTRKRSRYECNDEETPIKRKRRLNRIAAERSRAKKKENEEKLIYLAITLQAENAYLRSLLYNSNAADDLYGIGIMDAIPPARVDAEIQIRKYQQ
ncbi:hypothetical protein Glove_132g224 [Diversispora epigaea]|uniref:BZIP domain-containing protein n=1 Tax=Diversispora epigaea TaxID=1348612 RepID=A0A397IXW5_9GLOM|nr:hypothetical protein Glove_132g224 [Diversispora epigaea]